MGRHERRGAVRRAGATWQQAKRLRRDIAAEGHVAGKAARLTPEEARRALGEWAARGGDGQPMPQSGTFEFSEVNDPTNFNPVRH